MDGRLNVWLEREMEEYSGLLGKFKKRQMKWVPLWMAVSVGAMVALGFGVGYDFNYVLRVHFVIGCGIALFILFLSWIMSATTTMKPVRKGYEKAMGEFFLSEEDVNLFCRQMEEKNYDVLTFMNPSSEKFPTRFIAGPDYWVYFCCGRCSLVRVADIESIHESNESTTLSYNVGGTRVRQDVSSGASIAVVYKNDTASQQKTKMEKLYFTKRDQFRQAMELVKKRCPECQVLNSRTS